MGDPCEHGTPHRAGEAPDTLARLWRARCRDGGARPALRHKRGGIWTSLSWQGLLDQTRAIGLALLHCGVGPREVVSILSENRPEWLVADMAAQSIGAIAHGVCPGSSPESVIRALDGAGTCVLFAEHAAQAMSVLADANACRDLRLIVVIEAQGLRDIDDPRVVCYGELLTSGTRMAESRSAEFDAAIDASRDDAVAMLFATSGTTRVPRLVSMPQRDGVERLHAIARLLPLSPGDPTLSFASLSQPGERMAVLAALLVHDAPVHFAESPATLLNDLVEVAPRVLLAPPRFWERLHALTELFMRGATPLARFAWRAGVGRGRRRWWAGALSRRMRFLLGLRRVRMGLVTGGTIAAPAADWYAALDVPMYQAYGLAEAGGICTVKRLSGGPSPSALLAGVQLDLAPDGEVLVWRPASGVAYWRRGERLPLTTTAQGWLRTGDAGVRSAGGIDVVGRLAAKRSSLDSRPALPESAEQLLRVSPFICDAIVLARPDEPSYALLVLEEGAIRQYARDQDLPLADYADLVQHPGIEALLRGEIEDANRRLSPPLQLTRFQILPFVLASGMDEWTPALRLNRRVVLQRYAMPAHGVDAVSEGAQPLVERRTILTIV